MRDLESDTLRRLAWDAVHPGAGPNENPYGCGVTDCPDTAGKDHLCRMHYNLRRKVIQSSVDEATRTRALEWMLDGADPVLVAAMVSMPARMPSPHDPITRPVLRSRQLRIKPRE